MKPSNATTESPMKNDLAAHTIFCLDNSGSMKHGRRSFESFECVKDLILSQSKLQIPQLYSMVTFNIEAIVHFKHRKLCDELIGEITDIRDNVRPSHGTNFSTAFQLISDLIAVDLKENITYFIVFLSDGRPGDLGECPPVGREKDVCTVNKVQRASPSAHIRRLSALLGPRLTFFAVGIGPPGSGEWLARLVQCAQSNGANGSFWHLQDAAATPGTGVKAAEDDDSHSDVEFVPPPDLPLRRVFDLISATVTRTVGGTVPAALLEAPDAWCAAGGFAGETSYRAQRLVLRCDLHPPQLQPEAAVRTVRLRDSPFACGGQRRVHHLFDRTGLPLCSQDRGLHQVAKEGPRDLLLGPAALLPQQLGQMRAARLAKAFNALTAGLAAGVPAVAVLPCCILRLRDETAAGAVRLLAVERFLEGPFRKYNGNDGYVDPFPDLPNLTAQAFSHWTHCSQLPERLVVCDVQGVGAIYTDPAVCSQVRGQFGSADLGPAGVRRFLATHRCNYICKLLHLDNRI